MTKVTKTIQIETDESSNFDKLVGFLRSKSGHGAVILISCLVLTILTTFLYADALENIRGWQIAGILIGITFALCFELSVFWCAINGYVKASYLFAFFSLIIARATFEKFSEPELSFLYASTWIMTIAPVLIVLIASHKLAERYQLESLALIQEEKQNEQKTKSLIIPPNGIKLGKLNGQATN